MLDLTSKDRPWIAADTFLWSIIEVNTGLICACVPVLKPLFGHVVLKSLTDRSWSFGMRKISRSGGALKGDEEYSHRRYIELEQGRTWNQGTSTSTHVGRNTPERSLSDADPRDDQIHESGYI